MNHAYDPELAPMLGLIPTAAVSQRESEEMLVALRRGLKIDHQDQ
jgi:hypothetical protein